MGKRLFIFSLLIPTLSASRLIAEDFALEAPVETITNRIFAKVEAMDGAAKSTLFGIYHKEGSAKAVDKICFTTDQPASASVDPVNLPKLKDAVNNTSSMGSFLFYGKFISFPHPGFEKAQIVASGARLELVPSSSMGGARTLTVTPCSKDDLEEKGIKIGMAPYGPGWVCKERAGNLRVEIAQRALRNVMAYFYNLNIDIAFDLAQFQGVRMRIANDRHTFDASKTDYAFELGVTFRPGEKEGTGSLNLKTPRIQLDGRPLRCVTH